MNEIFLIEVDGKKVFARKKGVGEYRANFPHKEKENGIIVKSKVEREKNTWSYMEYSPIDKDYFRKVWLRDDGAVIYVDSANDKLRLSSEKFTPYAKTDDVHNQMAQIAYDVRKAIFEYEKLDVPTQALNTLRDVVFKTQIKLLGYLSPDKVKFGTENFRSMFSLSDVKRSLEKHVSLAKFCSRRVNEAGELYELSRIMSPEQKEDAMERGRSLNDLRIVLDGKLNDEISKFSERTEFYRNYGTDFDKKLPESEWRIYSSVVRKTANLIMGLNYDLLEETEQLSGEVEDLTKLPDEEVKKRINALVNSKEFLHAEYIEDLMAVRTYREIEDDVKKRQLEKGIPAPIAQGLEEVLSSVTEDKDKREILLEEHKRSLSKMIPDAPEGH